MGDPMDRALQAGMQSGDKGRSGEICKGEIKEMRSLHNRMRKK